MSASEPAEPELDREQMRAVAQVQRWHDFKAHVSAYLLINAILIIIWATTGGGTFWPGNLAGGLGFRPVLAALPEFLLADHCRARPPRAAPDPRQMT